MTEVFTFLKNIAIIVRYESKRYIFSIRMLVLIIISLLPTLWYINFAGQSAAIDLYLHELRYIWLSGHIRKTFVMFAYIINCAVAIVTIQQLIIDETALEILLSSTKRRELYVGKIIAAFIIIVLVSVFTWFGFLISLQSWNIFLPLTVFDFLHTFLTLIFVSLIPLSITVLCNTLEMKIHSIRGISTGIPIFIFFVIPFFIFSSIHLGFASESMLVVSIFFRIFQLTDYYFMPVDERLSTLTQINNIQTLFFLIILSSIILGWIFFKFSDAQTRKE